MAFLDNPVRLTAAGGIDLVNPPLASLIKGAGLMAVKLVYEAGFFHPMHSHAEHESMGIVLTGHMRMVIGGETVDLRAGDMWHHPVGVPHSAETLEYTEAVEIHTPLRPDLLAIFGA